MISFGLRFHDSAVLPFEERLSAVKAQGFDCVHIALSKTEGLPSDNGALTPGYAAYLKKAFRNANLDMAVLGCYLNLAHPEPSALKEIQKTYMAHIRFASLTGCGMVGTETGAPNAEYRYDKESCHSRKALELFINNLRSVVEYAEKMGVILAIEPVYKHIVYSPSVAREVLDTVSSPNLQIIFDPVNLLHPDNLDRRDEVIKEAISLLGPDIAMLHLKDYIQKDGELVCTAPGLGEMDYERIIEFAVTKKPYIQATLEDTKPENAKQALSFLKELTAKHLPCEGRT